MLRGVSVLREGVTVDCQGDGVAGVTGAGVERGRLVFWLLLFNHGVAVEADDAAGREFCEPMMTSEPGGLLLLLFRTVGAEAGAGAEERGFSGDGTGWRPVFSAVGVRGVGDSGDAGARAG